MPPGTYQTREWGNVFRHVPHRFIPARRLEGFCGRVAKAGVILPPASHGEASAA